MAKVRILSPSECKAFQSPPIFQPDERMIYFEITDAIKKVLDTLKVKKNSIVIAGDFSRV